MVCTDKSIIDLSKRNWRRNMAEINDLPLPTTLGRSNNYAPLKSARISFNTLSPLRFIRTSGNQIAVQERL